MTTYYNVEIQMAGDNKATQDFIEQFATNFGADKTDIDEIESHRAVLFFKNFIIFIFHILFLLNTVKSFLLSYTSCPSEW